MPDAVKRRLLILSFSPIAVDARVLKQVELFRDAYEVTTCGYGDAPDGVVAHLRIPDDHDWNRPDGRLITLRLYHRAFWSLPAVAWVREALRGGTWDVVLANDVETVPVALTVGSTSAVHADLHEYSSRLHEDNPAWVRRIAPYVRWIVRRYVARVASWSTVSAGLADEYSREFGFRPDVVTNATPYRAGEATPAHSPLRIVHSGVCLRNRDLLSTIRGVQETALSCTLDLYLMPNDPTYLEELRAAAGQTRGRVQIKDPVPYAQLVTTLTGYDLGIFVLPANTFSHTHALPNKLFDFVQARLAVLVGPSPEMAAYVRQYDLGAVADGFTPADIAQALDRLTPDDVTQAKNAAHAAAHDLSAESQVAGWKRAIDALASGVR